MRRMWRLGAAGLALFLSASPVEAHLMPSQHGTLNLRDGAVFGAFSIPVSALHDWDTNGDGRMSDAELAARHAGILGQLDAGIVISSGGSAGRRDLLVPSISIEEGDPHAAQGGTHLLVLVRQSFALAPGPVQLRLALFGRTTSEREFLVKALHDGTAPEVAILTPADPSHGYFTPLAGAGIRDVLKKVIAWIQRALFTTTARAPDLARGAGDAPSRGVDRARSWSRTSVSWR